MKILLATQNPGKYEEISSFLKQIPNVISQKIDEKKAALKVEETGSTYQENSLLKAKAFYESYLDFTLSDDAGLEIPILKNILGVKTRRFGAGENATDQEWLDFFLDYFKGYQGNDRVAYFKTVLCLYNGSKPVFFEGKIKGIISTKQLCEITPGIPLSSVFIPDGYQKAMSQMTVSEKNSVSHRAKALNKLKDFLIHNNE